MYSALPYALAQVLEHNESTIDYRVWSIVPTSQTRVAIVVLQSTWCV
jgi:hypothetical protein